MECKEFLEGYSAYLDGVVSREEKEAFREHLERCEACTRYDRVVQRGIEIFRNLPRPDPSPDFFPRLRHRLYHIEDGIPFDSARHGGSAALVAVAAVGLLALAWLPFATQMPVEVELPAVAVEAPPPEAERPMPSLLDPGPFVAPPSGGDASWLVASPGRDAGASLFDGAVRGASPYGGLQRANDSPARGRTSGGRSR